MPPLSVITAPSVLAAIAEHDELGREAFLARHGFAEARAYLLVHEGRTYDSKAIVGVAHGYATGRPLASREFSGGNAAVAAVLRRLGFTVYSSASPPWTRDEVILACDLVVGNGWRELRTGDPRVTELSELLQRLPIHPPIHPLIVRPPNFRSPDSGSRKTSDLYTAHPDYRGRPTRGGHVDREVVADFLRDPAGMARVAGAIRTAAAAGEFDELRPGTAGDDEDTGADEGDLLMRWHLVRERDVGLKRKKIESVRARGEDLACRVCGFDFDFERTYGVRGAGYIECHHAVPLHVTGRRTTRLDDLVLVCANCHRMIHWGPGWLSPSELRDCLAHAPSAR